MNHVCACACHRGCDDATYLDSIEKALAQAHQAHPDIDLVFYNAGKLQVCNGLYLEHKLFVDVNSPQPSMAEGEYETENAKSEPVTQP